METTHHNVELKKVDIDIEVSSLLGEAQNLLDCKKISKSEIAGFAKKVWALLEQKEVLERLKNPQALRNLSLSGEERKRTKIRNGMWNPGGSLGCVGGFGMFRALIERMLLQNVDEIIASSGGSWVTAYALAALDNIEMIRIGVSVFARDLRNRLFLDSTAARVVRRLLKQNPLLRLDRVYKLVAGKIRGMRTHKAVGKDKWEFKTLDTESVLKRSHSIRFRIAVTSLRTLSARYLDVNNMKNARDLLNALRASSSFAGILSKGSVRLNGGRFSDGDFSSEPFKEFRNSGVNSAVVSLSKPLRESLGAQMPMPVEWLLFLINRKARALEPLYRGVDVRYLKNILEMINFAKDHPIYVFSPDKDHEVLVSSEEGRTHTRMYGLYSHMYRQARKALEQVLASQTARRSL